jgi:hypothetical protein
MAQLSFILEIRKPWCAPQMAGTEKSSRQNLDRDSTWNLDKQNKQGE